MLSGTFTLIYVLHDSVDAEGDCVKNPLRSFVYGLDSGQPQIFLAQLSVIFVISSKQINSIWRLLLVNFCVLL